MNLIKLFKSHHQDTPAFQIHSSDFTHEVRLKIGQFPRETGHVIAVLDKIPLRSVDVDGLERLSLDIVLNTNRYNQIIFRHPNAFSDVAVQLQEKLSGMQIDAPISVRIMPSSMAKITGVDRDDLLIKFGENIYHPEESEPVQFTVHAIEVAAESEPIAIVCKGQRGCALDSFLLESAGFHELAEAVGVEAITIQLNDGREDIPYKISVPDDFTAELNGDMLTIKWAKHVCDFRITRTLASPNLAKPKRQQSSNNQSAASQLPERVIANLVDEPRVSKQQKVTPLEDEFGRIEPSFAPSSSVNSRAEQSKPLAANTKVRSPLETLNPHPQQSSLGAALTTFDIEPLQNKLQVALEGVVVAGRQIESRKLILTNADGVRNITHAGLLDHGCTQIQKLRNPWVCAVESGVTLGRELHDFADKVDVQTARVTLAAQPNEKTGLSRALSRKHFVVTRVEEDIFIEPCVDEFQNRKPLHIIRSGGILEEVVDAELVEPGDQVLAGLFLFKIQPL